jgi:hypothetical protein
MLSTQTDSSTCVILTATVQVKDSMVFTARRDTETRLEDYKQAFRLWLACPDVKSLVVVENSGFDLSALAEMASRVPDKNVEFLSFKCPDFDGSLGKGYGEMLCLEHCLQHSKLLTLSSRFLKVTGRYYLANASAVLQFIDTRRDAEVICDMLLNLSWADSRAFGGNTEFLRTYLCPMLDQLNDSRGSFIEHVLARAVHQVMANCGKWALPPFPLQIQGTSGSVGQVWRVSLKRRLKMQVRQALLARFLNSGPQLGT